MNTVLGLRRVQEDEPFVTLKKRFSSPVEAKRKVYALRRAGAEVFNRGSVVMLVTAILVEHLIAFDGWQKN